jgi:hypothetical protein
LQHITFWYLNIKKAKWLYMYTFWHLYSWLMGVLEYVFENSDNTNFHSDKWKFKLTCPLGKWYEKLMSIPVQTSTNDNKALSIVSSLSNWSSRKRSTSYFTPSTPLRSTITHNWILQFWQYTHLQTKMTMHKVSSIHSSIYKDKWTQDILYMPPLLDPP